MRDDRNTAISDMEREAALIEAGVVIAGVDNSKPIASKLLSSKEIQRVDADFSGLSEDRPLETDIAFDAK